MTAMATGPAVDDSSDSDDDALSLATSLNSSFLRAPAPPPPPPPEDPLKLVAVLGANGLSHLAGAGRERLLLRSGGVVWTLGPCDSDPPRFLPVGAAGRHGPGGAPVEAAACSPGGLIVLAHAAGAGKPASLTVWSAPALGLQTPRCLASIPIGRALGGGGASAVGFAGGTGVPFVWVASRAGRGAGVLVFDWRSAYEQAEAEQTEVVSGGALVAEWTPGGPGRVVHHVISDGGAADVIACGASFLCFLSLERSYNPFATLSERAAAMAGASSATDKRTLAAGVDGGVVPGGMSSTWRPNAPWDTSVRVPQQRAIGAGGADGLGGGFRWGGEYEDDAEATLERAAMPPPSTQARLLLDAAHAGGRGGGGVAVGSAAAEAATGTVVLASTAGAPHGSALGSHVRAAVLRPTFAPHGDIAALKPLHCLACEPCVGGSGAVPAPTAAVTSESVAEAARSRRVLAGALDGTVLEAARGRLVTVAWAAHKGVVSAVTYAGGGRLALAATVGEDGYLRLWALGAARVSSAQQRHDEDAARRGRPTSRLGSRDATPKRGDSGGASAPPTATATPQLLAQWEMRATGLGGPASGLAGASGSVAAASSLAWTSGRVDLRRVARACLACVPCTADGAAFDLVLQCGAGVHAITVRLPTKATRVNENGRGNGRVYSRELDGGPLSQLSGSIAQSGGGGGGGGGSSGGRTNPTGPPAAAARAAISDAEEVPWYSRGLHELHGPPRESLLLPDGCVADGRARVLTQGHRTPVHLLLVHPHTQAVLTVDALHVSVYDLLPAGVSLAACPRVSARLPPDETPSCAAIAQAGDRWAIGLSGGAILLLEEAPSRPHGAIFTRLERPPVASGPPPGPRPLPTLLTHPLDPPTALLASSTNPEFFHPTAPSHPLELDDATCLDERSGELPAGSSEFRQWSSSVPASSSGVSSVASSSASVGAPTTSTAGATASRSTAARKPVRAPDRSVVTIAFNAEGTMLAYACMDHVVGCHTLPLTHAQRTRRHLQRVARGLAPDPARTSRLTGRLANGEPPLPNMGGVVPDGAVDDARDDVICSAAVYMPPPCPTSGWSTEPTPTVALLWSVSSAHVFVLSRARTARPVAVHANGSLRPVHASAVGAAEWPADLDAAMTRALAACDSGALLAARWHPLPPTRAPSKRASLAPPAGMASEPRYGQPPIRPKSIRPRHLPELLSHATVSGGLAVIGGRLGELSVHSGLSWPLRSHEALDTAGDDVPKASYNPWASAYNPKYDMGSYSPYATAAHLLRAARSQPGSRTPSPSASRARDRSPGASPKESRSSTGRGAGTGSTPPPLVAHVAWTRGERFALTGDNQQPCLCVWARREHG